MPLHKEFGPLDRGCGPAESDRVPQHLLGTAGGDGTEIVVDDFFDRP